MSTDLVPKPSSKDDSRAYKSGVAAENTTIPLKKSLLARNDSEAGANNNGVSNPNAAGNPLATNDYQSTVRRSALFLCVEAFRGEASTMLQLRTQAIRALMKRWNIPHVSIDSFPHALVPNAGDEARSSNHSNIQEKLVTTKPQSAGDEARRSSHSNIQEKLVTTKPQSAGDEARRSSHSNIQEKLVTTKPQSAGDEARRSSHSNIQEKLVTTKPQSAGDEARRSSHSNIQEKLVTTKPQSAGDEARRSSHSNIQEKLVTTKPQSAGDEARRSSHSNIQEKLVTTKPQSAGDENVDRRSSHSNIPSQHNFEADLVPPTQQRVRKLAERFSTIEKQPFSCMCGQKFYAKSNLPTHKKKCLASKEEVDEEEDLAWAQKKRRSGGY
ncbi:hypothetical protein HID58_082475 [Brassica napus]|uniref:C2H2-type domain-containing protein n=2 Tax=Brassica napus TaxID=3708 RepID=A0ABQ7YAP5_BRANA|nr:hypothetical protein HID58_082475 [Brassica napus]